MKIRYKNNDNSIEVLDIFFIDFIKCHILAGLTIAGIIYSVLFILILLLGI